MFPLSRLDFWLGLCVMKTLLCVFFFSGSVVDSVPLWENNALFSNAALFI